MNDFDTPEAEIASLKERLADARREKDDALELVSDMRESLDASSEMIDSWIDVFEMEQDERGVWMFDQQRSIWDAYEQLLADHSKLVREWNKFVPRFNASVDPKDAGRPIAASEAQIAKVRALRKAGKSLRAIATETGLGLRTVRTILDRDAGRGRAADRKNELRKKEFNRMRAAAFRSRKRQFDALPKQLAEIQKDRARLQKAARGLAKSDRNR